MKERFKILKEFIRFILVSLPVFVIVFTAMHVGFFFYDCYKLIKKLYEKVLQNN
jgi:predicted membrane protein